MNVIDYFPNKRTMEDAMDNTNVSKVKIFSFSAFNLVNSLSSDRSRHANCY